MNAKEVGRWIIEYCLRGENLKAAGRPELQRCGAIMVRNGSCYNCLNCGSTSGCS